MQRRLDNLLLLLIRLLGTTVLIQSLERDSGTTVLLQGKVDLNVGTGYVLLINAGAGCHLNPRFIRYVVVVGHVSNLSSACLTVMEMGNDVPVLILYM